MTTKLVIVEDEGLFRDLLRVSLSSQPNFEVVACAGDANTGIEEARKHRPDVVLMDIELGSGMNGIEAAIRIRKDHPKVGIVILSMHRDREYLASLPAGQAEGWSYLLKQSVSDLSVLSRAIEGSAAGLMVLDPQVVAALRPRPGTRLAVLTPRERDTLSLMAEGFNNKAIADKLGLKEKSVENCINSIYQSLTIDRSDPVHPRVKAVLTYLRESRQESRPATTGSEHP